MAPILRLTIKDSLSNYLNAFIVIFEIYLTHYPVELPLSVANYFVKKSLETGRDLTPMHLLKLTYISHGWHLGIKGEPLITEAVEAWKYGPVIESLYHKFKSYGSGKVTSLETVFEPGSFRIITPVSTDISTMELLDKVYSVYNKFSALQLSSLTHQPNTPWDITIKQSGEGATIPNSLIEKHYKQKIANKIGGE